MSQFMLNYLPSPYIHKYENHSAVSICFSNQNSTLEQEMIHSKCIVVLKMMTASSHYIPNRIFHIEIPSTVFTESFVSCCIL